MFACIPLVDYIIAPSTIFRISFKDARDAPAILRLCGKLLTREPLVSEVALLMAADSQALGGTRAPLAIQSLYGEARSGDRQAWTGLGSPRAQPRRGRGGGLPFLV